MTTPTKMTMIALLAPFTASAGPVVLWQVPEYRADNPAGAEIEYAIEERRLADESFELERRKLQLKQDREAVWQARKHRRHARKAARKARMETWSAKRKGYDLYPYVHTQQLMERELHEAKDGVDLAKTVRDARWERVKLDSARRSLAKAELELDQSELLTERSSFGWRMHMPRRYNRQVNRIDRRADRQRADWNLAMVDVQEAYQDRYRVPTVVEVVEYKVVESADEAVASNEMDAHPGEAPHDLERVYFELDSDELSKEAEAAIERNAAILRAHREVLIEVEGHTDKTGPRAYNRELAWDRAEAVEEALLDHGVWPSQIELSSVGEEEPIVATEEPARANRRSELNVMSDPEGVVASTDPMDEDAIDEWSVSDDR